MSNSDQAIAGLRNQLNRQRRADELRIGERVNLSHNRVAAVTDTTGHPGGYWELRFSGAAPWFGDADATFYLAD